MIHKGRPIHTEQLDKEPIGKAVQQRLVKKTKKFFIKDLNIMSNPPLTLASTTSHPQQVGISASVPSPQAQLPKPSSKPFLTPPLLIPIDYYKTLDFVNNFAIQMVQTMNSFAYSCESKLSKVSSQIQHVEIVLSLLEKKLQSIDGMKERMDQWFTTAGMNSGNQTASSTGTTNINFNVEVNATIVPPPPSIAHNIPPPPVLSSNGGIPPPPPPSIPNSSIPPPPPSALLSNTPSSPSTTNNLPSSPTTPIPTPVTTSTAESPECSNQEDVTGNNVPTCEQDPRLANYFRLLNKIGVPKPQIARKMEMEGLDPGILDTPNAPSPLGVFTPQNSEHSESDNDSD
ncbi:hypothetical protein C9374_006166 [Naegleria lovaniensis]|uniref:Uncharacterized protein n=1 Tax=Naegleria lovaniensis TaxID=51637 RepID=A0AA88KI36_NAELO|nr:uncharacterized protein C9374_006166 [Naegleria lovaniensis]KAG2381782.1 hypothetical protein C9374_006166 [Naegleria lovaniensis]